MLSIGCTALVGGAIKVSRGGEGGFGLWGAGEVGSAETAKPVAEEEWKGGKMVGRLVVCETDGEDGKDERSASNGDGRDESDAYGLAGIISWVS
ncbi:MAG: hypothetical protein SGPRY_007355 [Prymnesium sp.]